MLSLGGELTLWQERHLGVLLWAPQSLVPKAEPSAWSCISPNPVLFQGTLRAVYQSRLGLFQGALRGVHQSRLGL